MIIKNKVLYKGRMSICVIFHFPFSFHLTNEESCFFPSVHPFSFLSCHLLFFLSFPFPIFFFPSLFPFIHFSFLSFVLPFHSFNGSTLFSVCLFLSFFLICHSSIFIFFLPFFSILTCILINVRVSFL